jgi:hypothetical protein
MGSRRLYAFALTALLIAAPLARAQSTAINGTIEGVVADSTGAVLPGVSITIANIDTGAQRSLTTGSDGLYRAPLLPLGTYRVRAELNGFKAVGADRREAVCRPDRGPELHDGGRRRQRGRFGLG